MFDDGQSDDDEPQLFCEREDWEDVTPLEQYENMAPIAPIMYTPEYKDATGYFRAIVRMGSGAQRVLELTEAVIRLNPGHYSAWQYRYDTAHSRSLMNELAVKYLKSYQVWHHRRLLVTLMRKPRPELAFITRSLAEDSKNYHTLDFVEEMLGQDVRNNSAWHHRFFVVWASGVREEGESESDRERILRRELIFVKQSISLAPNNPSAWNYLRGVLEHQKLPYSTVTEFVKPYALPFDGNVKDIIDLDNPRPSSTAQLPCASAIEFMADIYERENTEGQGRDEGILKAAGLWKSLADEHDTIRKK
ncbi:farnesyltransferase [Coprinopsis sp. MPI-PUGE-AT-0042]|nr:farnesyltransferase [Coprinopsis sp. MPI-PUGE-AT-0042]